MRNTTHVRIEGVVNNEVAFRDSVGVKAASFNLACQKGRLIEYYKIESYGRCAEFVNASIKKGEIVLIEGQLHQERFRTVEGIETRVIIQAQYIHLLK